MVEAIPEGMHYRLPDPEAGDGKMLDLIARFVPLDDTHWVLQLSEATDMQSMTTYSGVATWDGAELLVTAIVCDDLRDRAAITDLVDFIEDGCILRPGPAGAEADFPGILWQDLPPPDTRLVLHL